MKKTIRWILITTICFTITSLLSTKNAQAQTPSPTNVVSYLIDVELDTDSKTLTAQEVIRYRNLTDEPITELVFHLYLNAFRDTNSIFLQEAGVVHRGFEWDADAPGWLEVDEIALIDGRPLELEMLEDDTLARAKLPEEILTGEEIELTVRFTSQLPRVFARTGFAGEDFFMVGQWFPKLGVWEEGAWNAYPFHANAEFYADFGSYEVSITLPDEYVTGGTGLLVEHNEHGDGTQTVHYEANNVIDFAWTASPHFQEARGEVDGIEILYLYLPEHEGTVERALKAASAAVSHFNRWFGRYPYARLTIVDVPADGQGAGGMEYPTFVTAGTLDPTGLLGSADRTLETIIAHEVGHQWWQSMVAFNEAEEPWLDEGFTDYSTLKVMEAIYTPERSFIDSRWLQVGYLDIRRGEYISNPHVPMYGNAWSFDGSSYGIAAYSKPMLALHTLENVLGEEQMTAVMQTFFERYQFGHPDTEAFRVVAEDVSGETLDWFFEGLVYGEDVLNYAVGELTTESVTIVRHGELSIPTEILVSFTDGQTILEEWDGQPSEMTFSYPDSAPIQEVEIDPERKILLDLHWADNSKTQEADLLSWFVVFTRWLYQAQNALLGMGGL